MELSEAEKAKKKKELFDQMSPRQQRRILKKGFHKWDPFMQPKEPYAIKTTDLPSGKELRQLAMQIYREFMKNCPVDIPSHLYMEGAGDVASGLVYGDERAQGIYDFSCWFKENGKKYEPILKMIRKMRK